MDRESVSTFRNSSSEAGNSSFSVWKLEFLSVETEVYNCGNAKELIAFIRLLFVFCCRWQILQCFFNFMEEGIYHNYAHNCKTVG